MRSIPQAILERSQSLSEGGVLAPKEFLHLGSRAAVDQAFCRLAKTGQLMRIARGIYVAPVREKDQTRAPSAESLAKSIAAQGKRSKRLVVGSRTVYFQHAPYWLFSLGATPAGDALRAMAWVGKDQAENSAQKLRRHLAKVEWESLGSVRASLPSWMATALGRAAVLNELR